MVDGERIQGQILNRCEESDWVKVRCDDGTQRLVHVEDFELDRESEITAASDDDEATPQPEPDSMSSAGGGMTWTPPGCSLLKGDQ
jgi:hypothetical protein